MAWTPVAVSKSVVLNVTVVLVMVMVVVLVTFRLMPF